MTECFLTDSNASFRREYDIKEALERVLPRRTDSNKGTYGKLLACAGGEGMAGAALLCARAGYRTGCGLVYICTAPANRCIVQLGLPEAVYVDNTSPDRFERGYTAAVIGPGLGKTSGARRLLLNALDELNVPLVADADALNLIAEDSECQRKVKNYHAAKIFTPHMKELSRLLKKDLSWVKANRLEAAAMLEETYGCVAVSKDAKTVVYEKGKCMICAAQNDGMSTGGSGDVLSGIMGGVLAQSPGSAFEAAALAVVIHSAAGSAARERLGARYMLAGDIIEGMCEVLR